MTALRRCISEHHVVDIDVSPAAGDVGSEGVGGLEAGVLGLEGGVFDIGEGGDEVIVDEFGRAAGLVDGGVDEGARKVLVEVDAAVGDDIGDLVEDGDDGFEAVGLWCEVALGVGCKIDGGVGHGVVGEGVADFEIEELAVDGDAEGAKVEGVLRGERGGVDGGERGAPLAETGVLWRIPGYGFLKALTDSLDKEHGVTLRPVLVRFDDYSQLAFEVDQLPDGRKVIYIPSAPNPRAGSVLVLDKDRVGRTQVAIKHSAICPELSAADARSVAVDVTSSSA